VPIAPVALTEPSLSEMSTSKPPTDRPSTAPVAATPTNAIKPLDCEVDKGLEEKAFKPNIIQPPMLLNVQHKHP
jgi:hypothetical protein